MVIVNEIGVEQSFVIQIVNIICSDQKLRRLRFVFDKKQKIWRAF